MKRWGEKSDSALIDDDTHLVPTDLTWPRALRRVRSWLAPWIFLGHCWRAWSNAPPPPEIQMLLRSLGMGRPLSLYLRV
jgi:hypothetical protein